MTTRIMYIFSGPRHQQILKHDNFFIQVIPF